MASCLGPINQKKIDFADSEAFKIQPCKLSKSAKSTQSIKWEWLSFAFITGP